MNSEGRETASKSPRTRQGVASVEEFLNVTATETVLLFEHFEFEFLLEYDIFAVLNDVAEVIGYSGGFTSKLEYVYSEDIELYNIDDLAASDITNPLLRYIANTNNAGW